MANLNLLHGWVKRGNYSIRHSAQSYLGVNGSDKNVPPASACGAGDDEPQPSGCGSACGADDGK